LNIAATRTTTRSLCPDGAEKFIDMYICTNRRIFGE
jgi:hypothetical protein